LILAGGGGHTGYAYALAQALEKEASLFFLVPKGDDLSERRLNRFGEVKFLRKPRGPKTPTHMFAVNSLEAFIGSVKLISSQLDVVVGAGSNFCVPPAIVAWIRRIPIVNIESPVRFSRPSKTARLLQHFAVITALHWEEQRKLLNGVVVGPILPKPELSSEDGDYILVTGGTHGHKLLFDAISDSNMRNVIMQTGPVNPEPYAKRHPECKVFATYKRFHEYLAGARVVVTHFGLTALEAAALYRKPTVLVVNPEWTRTVGAEDAENLARKLDAVLITNVTTENLLTAIEAAENRKHPKLRDGAKRLATMILELLEKG
jgi:UDP-N-acetylglucosamine:LPS N-acetylglucosamine transferase